MKYYSYNLFKRTGLNEYECKKCHNKLGGYQRIRHCGKELRNEMIKNDKGN